MFLLGALHISHYDKQLHIEDKMHIASSCQFKCIQRTHSIDVRLQGHLNKTVDIA